MQDAIKGLRSASNISASKEGVLVIKVEDEDPKLAAEIANFYTELLDRLVAQYGTGEAGRQAGFLTAQLARAKSDLELTEEALRRFQERNRAIVLQEQTRGAIEAELTAGALIELKLSVALPDLQIRCGYRARLSAAGRQFMQAVRGNR